MVEGNIKPLIHLAMDFVIVVTDLFRGLFFLEGLDLSGSAILISAAYVQHVISLEFSIS